ncbi:sensor histidine kinase [Imhoffiella purpurea]|uniref:histidine kinase n=1 Tax=Imhoffiella purpurea TaxID=1249627 RepID=W9W1T5_9GAMM|nr:HAMP domain-containing sensor histidine kinase [Imhoffiella purpurea]EXJ16565.1 Signal transduction histidine kinase, nitrogen specific, NtrB [Imhoffiella purpurea]
MPFPRTNRLQRKVLLIIVAIVLAPMVVTGGLSASWISARMEASIEQWIREAARLDQTAIEGLHHNARLLADVLDETGRGRIDLTPGRSPIPKRLEPLAEELRINLVQVYGEAGELLYSSRPARLATSWKPGQDSAVVKVTQGSENRLAAITIVRIPKDAERHLRLVLGTLFDKALLDRLGAMSGLKTRLFYPRQGDFAKAFSQDDQRLQLPAAGLERLALKQDFYSREAEGGAYSGLYTPLVDATGRVEAVLFTGLAHGHGGGELLTDQGTLILVVVLAGSLLALGTGLLLSRLVVRPVESLHQGVMRLAAQDFRAQIPVRSHDELGELARAFNAMAVSLREARDAQRRELQRDKIAALGELSLAMAHEIRTPIGVVSTASRLLETSRDPERTSELRRMIREESQRIDRLLNDFQQLARHGHPDPRPLDPTAPLEQAVAVCLAGREDVRVGRDYRHGGARILADAELLRQAWTNLIRNAIQAMGEDGGELTLESWLDPEGIGVSLRDSGPGVPVEIMTRLFEPFFTTKPQGSGLGLTLANTLVEANGARLELVPDGGRGACFAMRFQPASDPEETR